MSTGLSRSASPAADLDYGGIPTLARLGFVARQGAPFEAGRFARGVDRLRGRPRGGRDQLGSDDLALLGIATGIAVGSGPDGVDSDRRRWLVSMADETADVGAWTLRARQLAADLLDGAGRMRAEARATTDATALDLVLRRGWPQAFSTVAPVAPERRQALMADLLASASPTDGEVERASVWLAALDVLVRGASAELVPDFDALVETLAATQSALRRWVWDPKPSRSGVAPARWLIDSEARVQAFL